VGIKGISPLFPPLFRLSSSQPSPSLSHLDSLLAIHSVSTASKRHHEGSNYELLDPIGSNGKIAATIAMTRYNAAQMKIGTLVVVSATVAMTAERIPMIRFNPIAMPFPVPR